MEMLSEVNSVRQQIGALRVALRSANPSAIQDCLSSLTGAAERLRRAGQLSEQSTGTQAQIIREFSALNAELELVQTLVIHGTALQQGWARLVRTCQGGYGARGQLTPLMTQATVAVKG